MRNEKGSALLLVLLVTVIFSILGLTILGAAISGAKRTAITTSNVDETYVALETLTPTIAKIKLKAEGIDLSSESVLADLDSNLRICELNSGDVIVKDLTSNSTTIPAGCAPLSSNDNYHEIDRSSQFTRIYEVAVKYTTSTGAEKYVKRKVFLSPTPSFLQYAVGSSSENPNDGLHLNGSVDITGSVYAPHLHIKNEADFLYEGANKQAKNIPEYLPYIKKRKNSETGELIRDDGIYNVKQLNMSNIENYNKQSLGSYFYEPSTDEDVPDFYYTHDFLETNFLTTYKDRLKVFLDSTKLTSLSLEVDEIPTLVETKTATGTKEQLDPIAYNKFKEKIQVALDNSFSSETSSGSIVEYDPEPGESTLQITQSIAPDGNPTWISIDKDATQIISSDEGIVIDSHLLVNGDLSIYGLESIDLRNVYVSGNIMIKTYSNQPITIHGDIFAKGNISVESSGGSTIEIAGDIVSKSSILLISNEGYIKIDNNILAADSVTLDNYGNELLQFTHNNSVIFVGGDLNLKGDGDSSLIIPVDLMIGRDLTIIGQDSSESDFENDNFLFDSTSYNLGNAKVENANIKGIIDEGEEKQLVILSQGDLYITRINEFNNPSNNADYDNIVPLKAFFYTESSATLFGVGSLFKIDGGIFAKDKLTINAVRGKVTKTDLNRATPVTVTCNTCSNYSRFSVSYDRNVLLDRLNALPRVNRFRLILEDIIFE